MRIAVVAVGKRTEHWVDLFRRVVQSSQTELDVYAADVSSLAQEEFEKLEATNELFRYRLLPHRVGEDATGHMASVALRRGSLHRASAGRRPDVLHIIGEAAYLSTWQTIRFRAAAWAGVPIALYAAQNVLTRFPWPFPLLERYAFANVQMMLPITPAAESVIRRKGYEGRSSIVPLGVDRDLFMPRAKRRRRFTAGYVGRLEEHKGIRQLLQAARTVECQLRIVGNGSLRSLVEEEQRIRPGAIELLPWVSHSELPRELCRMDVLVLPSIPVVQRNFLPWIKVPLREQFGRVLVEAMACAIPVVATDVGEIAYVVGDSGLLVAPGDCHGLAQALLRLRDTPDLADELARNGLKRSAKFDWGVIAKQLLAIWQELAHRAPE